MAEEVSGHCGHECVCFLVPGIEERMPEFCCEAEQCEHDTRRPAQQAPAAPKDEDCDTCWFGEQCRVTPYLPPCYHHAKQVQQQPPADALAELEAWAERMYEVSGVIDSMDLKQKIAALRREGRR